jgi:AcrR family transcriptional regulator
MPGQKKVKKPAAAYHAHRERQRRRILDAAGELFDERGIDRVTMADITAASGVQPSTTYQYFSNKEEVVWTILRETMEERGTCAKRLLESAATAESRISLFFGFFEDELVKNPLKARFMAQFDAMYARDWPAERLLALESQIFPEPFDYFSTLVREGIADGSLRSDLNPDLTMHAVINAVIGTQRRLASLGNKVELEYGHPIDRMFRETLRILLLGMRAPEKPKRRPPQKQAAAVGRNRKLPS